MMMTVVSRPETPSSVVDIECPDPASLNTEQIIFAGDTDTESSVYNYQDTVR